MTRALSGIETSILIMLLALTLVGCPCDDTTELESLETSDSCEPGAGDESESEDEGSESSIKFDTLFIPDAPCTPLPEPPQ